MTTPQRRIRKTALVLIGPTLLLFLLLRFRLVVLPRSVIFLFTILLMVLSSAFWWAWVDERLCRGARSGPTAAKSLRWLRGAWAMHLLAVLMPLAIAPLGGRRLWDAVPVPVIMYVLGWHMSMVFLVSGILLVRLVWGPVRWFHKSKAAAETAPAPPNPGRRAFLVGTAMLAPPILAGASIVGGLSQAGRIRTRRLQMKLPRLPTRLRGLTITHLSDLHLGRLFRPEHLPRMVEEANRLASDLVVVTGDIVDHSNDFLPAACEALGRLESRYGRYCVIGNHDLIDSPEELVAYMRLTEPGLLLDRWVPVMIGGETIQMAGLLWSRNDQPQGRDPGHAGRVAATLESANAQRFTIALAHHPHAFDPLADRGVDLTLAGHTHGGQLMLTPPGSAFTIGAGNLLFRYIYGEYHRGNSTLYVTSGVGNWFPLRINAPAEIVQIQLV